MCSFRPLLFEKRGSVMIWVPVLVLLILTMCTVFWEYSRLNIIAQGTRDAAQAAITQICTDNYDRVYNGVREGYSGGYTLEDASWTDDVDTSSILSKIDSKLGTKSGEKTSNGTMEYRISDLDVQIQNAPLAPTGTDVSQQFLGTATYTLTVPMSFGKQLLPPIVFHMEASGGYSQKGALSGAGGSGGGADQGKAATGISLSESDLTLEKGAIETLAAAVSPEDATDSLSWVATNPDVCSVNQTGTITARAAGQSTIIAAAQNGSAIAQCNVSVVTPVTGILLNKFDLTLAKGQSETLTATISPADATNKKGMWTSSDAFVCTVDGNGKVTAVNAGMAIITATTQDGNFSDQCTVTVIIPTSGITLNKTNLTLIRETSETLTATVWPNDATKSAVLWASSDETICTVDQTGKIVAIKPGNAVVSATTYDGQYTAVCAVTVKPKTYRVTANAVNGYVLGTGVYNEGSTVTLTAVPDPHYHFVCWTDSNSTVIGWGTTYTISSLSADTTVNASFAIDMFTVTVNAGTGGYVTGGGTYPYGSEINLRAISYDGYRFANWSDGYSASNRTITVTDNITLTAYFRPNAYTWTVNHWSENTQSIAVSMNVPDNRSTQEEFDYKAWKAGGTATTATSHSKYTFDYPVLLCAGSTIRVISGYINQVDKYLYINDVQVATVTDYDASGTATNTQSLVYRILSDTYVSSVEMRCTANAGPNSWPPTSSSCVFVCPMGGKSFMLNSSKTSEGQDYNNAYYQDSPQNTNKTKDFVYVGLDYINYRHGVSNKAYFHFVAPKSIEHIEFGPTGSGNSAELTVVAKDIFGVTNSVTKTESSQTSSANIYNTDFTLVNMENVSDLEIGFYSYSSDSVSTKVTVYFNDGTSLVLGTNTATGEICGGN